VFARNLGHTPGGNEVKRMTGADSSLNQTLPERELTVRMKF